MNLLHLLMKSCTCGVNTGVPWWLLGLAAIWLAFGAYWHTCLIKDLCSLSRQPFSLIHDIDKGAVWKKLSVEPLTVYFGINNNNVISEGVQPELEQIVAYLMENPTAKISIEGHTNHYANDINGYTQRLAMERASTMKDYLVKRPMNLTGCYLPYKRQRS